MRVLFFLLAASLFFNACRRDDYDQNLSFVGRFEVPAGLGTVLTYNFPIPDILGTSASMSKAQVLELRLYAEQGENSFGHVRQAFVEITTDTSRLEIGYNTEVLSNNANNISLFPNEADIKTDIGQANFNLTVRLNFRTPTVQISTIRLEMLVGVKLD
jgi:hypothetical protein